MSMMACGCLGARRILAGIGSSPSLLRERNGRGQAGLIAHRARGVSLAGGVLHQAGVAGAEDVLGAIAEPDLQLAGEDDDELPARRGMPVERPAHRPLAERDLGGRQPLLPVRHLAELDRLDVRMPVAARVESERPHRCLLISWSLTGGMLAQTAAAQVAPRPRAGAARQGPAMRKCASTVTLTSCSPVSTGPALMAVASVVCARPRSGLGERPSVSRTISPSCSPPASASCRALPVASRTARARASASMVSRLSSVKWSPRRTFAPADTAASRTVPTEPRSRTRISTRLVTR